ncbi:unnamed protein product [Rhizophagus irregularis]|nr:unnamed protein product [Rhizophagus irregularis]
MEMDSLLKARDALDWPDRTSPPTSPVSDPEKGKDSPAPVQDNQLLNEFFEAYKEYKAYTSLSGPDLRKAEIRKGFFDQFTKEYGKREEDWCIYDDDWHDWDDLFY